jgi:predicted phage terminase large subunit-like protein
VDDLPGKLIAEGTWRHLDLPMTAYLGQKVEIAPGKFWLRKPGDLLHPERFGPKEIANLKSELGTAAYTAQYDQRPVPPAGHLFKLEWFRRYEQVEFKLGFFELIVQSWDTALSCSETANYSACTTWGIRGKEMYLLNAFRDRLSYTDLKRKVLERKKFFHADLVIVEKAAAGLMLCEDFAKEDNSGWLKAFGPSNRDSKTARAEHQTAKIERGEVLLPAYTLKWKEPFETELAAFPHGKNDDWVDTMTQFLRAFDFPGSIPQFQKLARFRETYG